MKIIFNLKSIYLASLTIFISLNAFANPLVLKNCEKKIYRLGIGEKPGIRSVKEIELSEKIQNEILTEIKNNIPKISPNFFTKKSKIYDLKPIPELNTLKYCQKIKNASLNSLIKVELDKIN